MNAKRTISSYKQRLLIATLTGAGLSFASGCGNKVVVDPSSEPLSTAQRIKDWPVNQKAPVIAAEEQGAWYNEFANAPAEIHPLDQQPQPTSQGQIEHPQTNSGNNAPPSTAGILQAIQNQVEQQRPENSKWSLLLLEAVPEDPRRGGPMEVRIDLGLTKLYSKCPEIKVSGMTYEQVMTQLCVRSGIRLAPAPKLKNPVVNWSKENVSVFQAMQAISQEHGFGIKLVGVGGRLTWRARDFSTRENFVKEVVNSIFAKGEIMDRDVPTLIMFAYQNPSTNIGVAQPEPKQESELSKLLPSK